MWLTELPPYLQQIQLFNTLTHSYKHLNKCSPLPINNGIMAFLLALPSLLLLRPNTFLEAIASLEIPFPLSHSVKFLLNI